MTLQLTCAACCLNDILEFYMLSVIQVNLYKHGHGSIIFCVDLASRGNYMRVNGRAFRGIYVLRGDRTNMDAPGSTCLFLIDSDCYSD
jgi:hypothetical protein